METALILVVATSRSSKCGAFSCHWRESESLGIPQESDALSASLVQSAGQKCPRSKDSDRALALLQVCKGWPCQSCRAALLGRVPPTAHPLPTPWRGCSGSQTPPFRKGTCTSTEQKLGWAPPDIRILLRACRNEKDLPAVLTSRVKR